MKEADNHEEANEALVKSLPEYQKIADLVVPFFQDAINNHGRPEGSYEGMDAEEMLHKWMVTENVGLGGVMPLTMILMGRGEKLLNYVKDRLDEGKK